MIGNSETLSCLKLLRGLHYKSITSKDNNALFNLNSQVSHPLYDKGDKGERAWDLGCTLCELGMLTGNRLFQCLHFDIITNHLLIILRGLSNSHKKFLHRINGWKKYHAWAMKNRVNAFLYPDPVFHAQPKVEKKIHTPEKLLTHPLP